MAPRNTHKHITSAIAAALGQRGGHARAAALSATERSAIARKAGKASKGWPKGKKRGASPLKGRKVTR